MTIQDDSIWAAGFATNIHKYLQNLDYFTEISNYDFLLHTWSLAVEIQFYLIVPVLMVLLSVPFAGKLLWCAVFFSSLWYNITATGPLQFSSLQSRMWQFICGGIVNILPKEYQNSLVLVPGLVLLSPVTFLLPLSAAILRLICTLSAATVIYFGNELTNKYVLGNSVLCFVGDVSYSVYLYHWPTIICYHRLGTIDFPRLPVI
ncbi:unnamed protein product [Enterobius vermicularis]|uniref:Acyl_transf_3 domain-containing protein n=1 Tax=Enterobius vermicularis TaxID=51028 RepID=A0A0N4VLI0_ENTVE|nr:unnamed protein product [Enterobius vermicularis]